MIHLNQIQHSLSNLRLHLHSFPEKIALRSLKNIPSNVHVNV